MSRDWADVAQGEFLEKRIFDALNLLNESKPGFLTDSDRISSRRSQFMAMGA
jgi:hypothetical protein